MAILQIFRRRDRNRRDRRPASAATASGGACWLWRGHSTPPATVSRIPLPGLAAASRVAEITKPNMDLMSAVAVRMGGLAARLVAADRTVLATNDANCRHGVPGEQWDETTKDIARARSGAI